ncbi:hypothetical protein WH47_09401 [Habropoda laboriosa]|uniref:Uncharacterized protein n=1 Tax=Habropoda laboriosa TaxID=597456 RepID=A0A0L7RF38_9HYME|nr:hypothetical protein WH47_09401 [Habropoda laboriosa]
MILRTLFLFARSKRFFTGVRESGGRKTVGRVTRLPVGLGEFDEKLGRDTVDDGGHVNSYRSFGHGFK